MYLRTTLLQLEIIFYLYLSALVQLDESGILLTYTFETIFDLYPSTFLLWRVLQLNTSTRNYFGYGPEHLIMSRFTP